MAKFTSQHHLLTLFPRLNFIRAEAILHQPNLNVRGKLLFLIVLGAGIHASLTAI
jgi:hypothetical protein